MDVHVAVEATAGKRDDMIYVEIACDCMAAYPAPSIAENEDQQTVYVFYKSVALPHLASF